MLEKKQNNRIILVLVMILQGVPLMISNIIELINQKPTIRYEVELFPYYQYIGIIIGILLIISGIGIHYKRVIAHYLSFCVYSILTVFSIASIILIYIKGLTPMPLPLYIFAFGYIALMIYFTYNSKVEIQNRSI